MPPGEPRSMPTVPDFSPARNASDQTLSSLVAKCGCLGGVTFAAFYVAYGIAFEAFVIPQFVPPGTPRLSYGQQAVMIMMPLAALLGAGFGTSIAFGLRTVWWLAGASVSVASVVIGAAVAGLWKYSFGRYGADPSDWILYFPLLMASLAGFLFGMALTVFAVATVIRRRFGQCDR